MSVTSRARQRKNGSESRDIAQHLKNRACMGIAFLPKAGKSGRCKLPTGNYVANEQGTIYNADKLRVPGE